MERSVLNLWINSSLVWKAHFNIAQSSVNLMEMKVFDNICLKIKADDHLKEISKDHLKDRIH